MARAKKTDPAPRQQRPVESVRSEKFVSGYANYVGVTTTPWDVRLNFGEIVTATPEKLAVIEFASVVMSPQHAKSLLLVLAQQLAEYEKQHGPIPAPGVGRGGSVVLTPGTGALSLTGAAPAVQTKRKKAAE